MESASPIPIPDKDVLKRSADVLAAVGNMVRVTILWHLSFNDQNVAALMQITGKRQQAVSHHLTILKLRKLVTPHRRGKGIYYHLTDAGRAALWTAPFHS